MQLYDIALLILDDFVTHLMIYACLRRTSPPRFEAEVLLRRLFHEIFLLNVERAGEWHEAVAAMNRIVVCEQPFLPCLPDNFVMTKTLGMQDSHDAVGILVEVSADFMLEHRDIDDAVGLKPAPIYPAEIADGRGV